jgi:hypothetical protein
LSPQQQLLQERLKEIHDSEYKQDQLRCPCKLSLPLFMVLFRILCVLCIMVVACFATSCVRWNAEHACMLCTPGLSPQQQLLQERLKEIHDSECCDG